MRYVLAIIGLLATIAISFFGFIVVIVTLKEGFAASDLLIFLLILIPLVLIFLGWYTVLKKTDAPIMKVLGGTGMALPLLPFLFICYLGAFYVFQTLYGNYLAKFAVLMSYKETPIIWPNFSYPVGVKIELEVPNNSLIHQARYETPFLWMGRDGLIDRNKLFSSYATKYAFLAPPLLNRYQRAPAIKFDGSTSKIVHYLYPGVIFYIESPNAFCKIEKGNVQAYGAGSHINGMISWRHHYTVVDLSLPFHTLLSTNSVFENNPELWDNMHKQFQDENLLAAGYKRCQIDMRKNCFCKN